jgi:hypothetical protein
LQKTRLCRVPEWILPCPNNARRQPNLYSSTSKLKDNLDYLNDHLVESKALIRTIPIYPENENSAENFRYQYNNYKF